MYWHIEKPGGGPMPGSHSVGSPHSLSLLSGSRFSTDLPFVATNQLPPISRGACLLCKYERNSVCKLKSLSKIQKVNVSGSADPDLRNTSIYSVTITMAWSTGHTDRPESIRYCGQSECSAQLQNAHLQISGK